MIDAVEVVLPRNLRLLLRIEVDPNETITVNMDMDRKQAVPAAVEVRKLLVARSFGKVAVETI